MLDFLVHTDHTKEDDMNIFEKKKNNSNGTLKKLEFNQKNVVYVRLYMYES